MKNLDRDGALLCRIQGRVFEESRSELDCSSDIFIRRFMHSEVATEFDSKAFLDQTKTVKDVFLDIKEEYGDSTYGKRKYNKEVLYWMGYIYRYFAYCYEIPSKNVYLYIKPLVLSEYYNGLHSLDPKKVIDTILEEEKGITSFEEYSKNRLENIFKEINS